MLGALNFTPGLCGQQLAIGGTVQLAQCPLKGPTTNCTVPPVLARVKAQLGNKKDLKKPWIAFAREKGLDWTIFYYETLGRRENHCVLAGRQEKLSGSGISASIIEWLPSEKKTLCPVPHSLYYLCLRLLCEHVEHIESLEGLCDAAKKKICLPFCASRRMTLEDCSSLDLQISNSNMSVHLSPCAFLSEAGIHTMADSLAPLLKELHLEECHQLEALKILSALKKMQNLEISSVAAIPSVTDAFTSELLAHLGYNLRELSLADCGKTTDYSLETIGVVCCGLNSLTLDGPAVLHELGRFPVHSLEIPSFLSTKTPEEALVHVVGEARRTASSILPGDTDL
eukprot:Gb_27059 [translate_table: standard]